MNFFLRNRVKWLLLSFISISSLAFAGDVLSAEDITLNGGGASFPAPLYVKWFKDYHRANPDIRINYQAMGSGAGIHNFMQKRLDFAGSDIPLTDAEAAKVDAGVVQVPMTGGAVVLIYNLDGVYNLRLTREAYTGIFLGKITHWQDPIIAQANKGVRLPNREIIIVARMKSSGTTYVFTRHLSAVSRTFRNTVGTSKDPSWPSGIKAGGRLVKTIGNGGVSQMVKVVPGAIGFVEFTYAYFTDIAMATLQNRSGQFIAPAPEAFQAAVDTVGLRDETLADPEGAGAYPILALTWLLFYERYEDPLKFQGIKNVLAYCLNEGQRYNTKLGYIPLPESLLNEARMKAAGIRLGQ